MKGIEPLDKVYQYMIAWWLGRIVLVFAVVEEPGEVLFHGRSQYQANVICRIAVSTGKLGQLGCHDVVVVVRSFLVDW